MDANAHSKITITTGILRIVVTDTSTDSFDIQRMILPAGQHDENASSNWGLLDRAIRKLIIEISVYTSNGFPNFLIVLNNRLQILQKWSGGAGGPGHRSFLIQTGVGVCRCQGKFRVHESPAADC